MPKKQSYSEWVEAWSNPALLVSLDKREVLAVNTACTDVFGEQLDWLKIGNDEWTNWWKKPTDRARFELRTSNDLSRLFLVRSGELDTVGYVVFEDEKGWRELRNAFEVNKTRYQGLAAGTMEGLAFMQNNQIIDLNAEMMGILGISKLEELQELDVQNLFGLRNWKKLVSRAGHIQEFHFTNTKGRDLMVEGKIETLGPQVPIFGTAGTGAQRL